MNGYEKHLEVGKTPWGIWWGLIAGFLAWGLDLGFSYVLQRTSCYTGHESVLHAITAVCLLMALSGFAAGFSEFRHFSGDSSEEGGRRLDRAHFQAILAIMFSLGFALVVLAGAVPRWILNPCD